MDKNDVTLTFSYVNENANLDISAVRKVIRMSPKGFCIAIISGEKKAERLFQYLFDKNDLSFNDKLKAILVADKELNINCKEHSFRLYTLLNVQIPDEFYEQENDTAILSLITEDVENYVSVVEKIEGWNLYNLSAWEKNLHAGVKKKFPDYKLNTVLSSLLPIMARQKDEKNILIFVGDNNFTVLATDRHKLLGINTFPFTDEHDFLYYFYAFLRKMYVNTDTISIKLGGNIAPQSSLYTILNKYFSTVEMVSVFPNEIENYSYFCDLFE